MAQSELSPETTSAPAENILISGLQKHLGFRGSARVALAGCLGLAELLPLGIGMGLWPSVDMVNVVAIAIGVNLFIVLLYTLISAAAPLSGADYVFTSRVIPAPFAFASFFCLVIAVALAVGALAVLVSQAVMTPFLLYSATQFQNSNLADFAIAMTQPQGSIISGTVIVFLAFLIAVLSPKTNGRVLSVLLALGLAGWAAIIFQLLGADSAGFATRWDNVVGQGSYAGQISAARALSLMFTTTPSPFFLAGIPLGFLIFFGARLPVLHSEEIRGSSIKSTLWGGLLALLVSGGLAVVTLLLLSRLLPGEWMAAESHLYLYNNQLEKPALPWLPFYAVLLQPNYPLFVVSSIGLLAASLAALQVIIRAFGRTIFAWARDGFLVELARYVHSGNYNPLVTTLLFTIVAQIGVSIAATVGAMKTLNSSMFALVCAQIFPALAAVFYPLARSRWLKHGDATGGKVPPVLLTFLGLLTLAFLGWTIATTFIYPAQGVAINRLDLFILGGGFVVGLVMFFWQAINFRRHGESFFQSFRQIPKE